MATCKYCGKTIYWKQVEGKWKPFNNKDLTIDHSKYSGTCVPEEYQDPADSEATGKEKQSNTGMNLGSSSSAADPLKVLREEIKLALLSIREGFNHKNVEVQRTLNDILATIHKNHNEKMSILLDIKKKVDI